MTEAKLAKVNEIKKSIDRAIEIKNIFWGHYVEVKAPEGSSVSSVWLDKETRDEWMQINRDFFEKKIKELEEEFKRI
jgi:hypothetical protein